MTTWDRSTGDAYMHCEHEGCDAKHRFPRRKWNGLDFPKGTTEARALGWYIWTENGTWHHLCPVHNPDGKKESAGVK